MHQSINIKSIALETVKSFDDHQVTINYLYKLRHAPTGTYIHKPSGVQKKLDRYQYVATKQGLRQPSVNRSP